MTELVNLVDLLDKTRALYREWKISADEIKLMTSNVHDITGVISANGQRLETVSSFEHLDSVVTDDGSKP